MGHTTTKVHGLYHRINARLIHPAARTYFDWILVMSAHPAVVTSEQQSTGVGLNRFHPVWFLLSVGRPDKDGVNARWLLRFESW